MILRTLFAVVIVSAVAGMAIAGPAELFAQATAELQAGNDNRASSLFEQIVADFPASPEAPEAALRRAYLGLRLKEPHPDGLFLRVTARYAESSQAADALRRLGYLKQREGDLEAAQSFFQQAASHPRQSEKGKVESLVNWAFLDISKYFAAGFPDRPKFDGTFLVLQSRATERTQRLEAARQKLNTVLESIRDDERLAAYAAFAQSGIGETYILQERWSEAEQAYKMARDDFGDLPAPVRALSRHGLALAMQRQCRFDEALVEEESALVDAEAGGAFLGASSNLIKADSASQAAVLLMGRQRYGEAVDLLTTTLASLTAQGAPEGELREAVATVAAWRVVALHKAGLSSERNAALRDVLQTFASTEAADMALKWSLKYGWG